MWDVKVVNNEALESVYERFSSQQPAILLTVTKLLFRCNISVHPNQAFTKAQHSDHVNVKL